MICSFKWSHPHNPSHVFFLYPKPKYQKCARPQDWGRFKSPDRGLPCNWLYCCNAKRPKMAAAHDSEAEGKLWTSNFGDVDLYKIYSNIKLQSVFCHGLLIQFCLKCSCWHRCKVLFLPSWQVGLKSSAPWRLLCATHAQSRAFPQRREQHEA